MSCPLAFQSISGGDPTIDLHNFRDIQNGQLTFADCRVSAGKSRGGTNHEMPHQKIQKLDAVQGWMFRSSVGWARALNQL